MPPQEQIFAMVDGGQQPVMNTNLDPDQRQKVAEWIAQGEKLSDIQSRIASELGVRLTYMDVRLLVDDLKLTPKDEERSAAPVTFSTPASQGAPPTAPGAETAEDAEAPSQPQVTVRVDQIARPGAVVSGKVTFSDGNSADWYFDQTGRLGLIPQSPGYRPPPSDLQEFQTALDSELSRMGF